jgi:hypothetical protein
LVESEEAAPAAERAVLLTELLSAVELLVPEPELLALDWVAPGADWAVPNWLAPEPAEPVLEWLAPAVPEPECPVRAFAAALTVEPTTELAVEAGESAEDWAGPGGGGGSVAACACRENTSMMKKIPAARIANCTAR